MYKIYWVNFSKIPTISEYEEIGARPVVCVGHTQHGDYICYQITSRNRNDEQHIHMDNYIIHGYMCIDKKHIIPKDKMGRYLRKCTTKEIQEINAKLFQKKSKIA